MKQLFIPDGASVQLNSDMLTDKTCIIVGQAASLQLDYIVTGIVERKLEIVLQERASCEQIVRFDQAVTASLSFIYTLHKQSILKVNSKTRLTNNSLVRLDTQQRHIEPQAHSDILCKVVVSDNAQWQYTGTIFIAPDAQGTVAQQMNPCLIDGSGTIKSIPIIEVLAHEVSCKHGAASGKLDEEALRYLGMRGMAHHEARQLIIDSFLR